MYPAYHIIVADPTDVVRELLVRVLVSIYPRSDISSVPDGAQALQVYNQRGADLLITSYTLPAISGLDLVRMLRARQATLPILLLAADASIEAVALLAGATVFLVKPFDVTNLRRVVTSLLAP